MTSPAESSYTLRRVQELLGLSRSVISGLIGAGFVTPTRGARNEHRFTFQDLMLLRTAYGLQKAKIPPRKILRSLTRLKASLPDQLPLTGMRITAVGADVAVRDRQGHWAADTGQLLMDFEVAPAEGSLAFLMSPPAEAEEAGDPAEWMVRGEALEASDPEQAESAYRRALALAPGLVDAYLNLGALLCDLRRHDEAVLLYEQALPACEPSALLHFNLGVALEDLGRLADAVASYERSLAIDPALADAHFNIARLQEQLGDVRSALRHLNTYRRLSR
ncbi:MAG: tetratricopeptide repeat protein [Variovorax sp.]|nr:MAG: tetratricopeptide repeat protein [Variovorax sp.]